MDLSYKTARIKELSVMAFSLCDTIGGGGGGGGERK